MKKYFGLIVALSLIFPGILTPTDSHAESRVESNVIYGMHSGLALLMDVHYPADANGYGIIFIPGSGWTAPLSPDAKPLKQGVERTYLGAQSLLDAGYTVFSINHRAAPRYFYPDPLEDTQRAIRYVRYHADRFAIDKERIGAVGGSSGGHLALMLAVMDGEANQEDPSPINRVSAKVQTAVAIFAPTDFIAMVEGGATGAPLFKPRLRPGMLKNDPEALEVKLYREASPISYVSEDDPPILMIHGDQDNVVPYSQSEIFATALQASGVKTRVIRMPGGGHGPSIVSGPDSPDYLGPMIEWFDDYLKR